MNKASNTLSAADRHNLIYRLAREGKTAEEVCQELQKKGVSYQVQTMFGLPWFMAGRREYVEVVEAQKRADRAARRERAERAWRERGVRHPAFPGITLPRVSIQEGCATCEISWWDDLEAENRRLAAR